MNLSLAGENAQVDNISFCEMSREKNQPRIPASLHPLDL